VEVKIEFPKLKGWNLAISPARFRRELRKQMRKATVRNSHMLVAKLRQRVRSSDGLDSNASLTQSIKKDDKPLVGDGTADLFKGITRKMLTDFSAAAGVLRTAREFNVARMLHEGGEARVTPRMRGMFLALWQASNGELEPDKLTGRAAQLWERMPGGWKPLSESTTAIVIPERPFVRLTMADPEVRNLARKSWERGFQATMRNRARGK
jgi:hypothetical protein